MTAAVVVAAAGQFPSDDAKVGAKDENTEQGSVHDAGEVLLSILTCHCITQSSLFQRLIRGAVQFEGIGVRRFGRRRLSHCNQNAPVARHMVPKPPQDRSSRLLLHSIRWIRKRQGGSNARGGRGRSRRSADITHDIEEESAEEAAVGAGCGGGRDGSRSTGGGRFEGGNCTNNVREASCKTETAEDYDDSVDGAYSSQPEAVIMASPRECYTVLTRAVATYEAALLASLGSFGGSMPGRGSGVLPGGSDSASSLGGDYFDQEEVSEVLCVVAGALREFFSTSSTGLSCTTSTVTVLRAQNHGESCSSRHADAIGNDNIAAAAELPGVDEANLAATVSADEVYSAVSVSKRKADELCTSDEAVREEMKKTPAPDRRAVVTSLPEAVKLRLMQTLERFYLTGRAVSLVASAALTTPPPPTAVQWTGKRSPELKHDAEVESPTAPDADHVPIPSSPTPATSAPPPSKRRRHDTREESVVKPADQAAGTGRPTRAARTRSLSRRVSGGCCAPVLAATGAVAVEEERKDSAEHPEVPRIPPTTRSEILCEKVNNGDNKASVGVVISHDVKSLGCKGLENGDSAADHIVQLLARVGLGEAGGWLEEGGSMAEATRRLLEAVLPAAVMASSKCLELMSLVRAWAEAERAQDRRTGDDPCRKKVIWL